MARRPNARPAPTSTLPNRSTPVMDPAEIRPVSRAGGVKVRATKLLYYGLMRRRPGDVFTISNRKFTDEECREKPHRKGQLAEFNPKCMEFVSASTPESVTTPLDALRQEHDRIVSGSRHESGLIVPPDEGEADDNPLGAD